VAIDGVRHTWTSFHRTLSHLVLAEFAPDLLRRVSCRTVAIVGAEDRVTRPEWCRTLAAEQPGLGLQVLPDVDHHPVLRVPVLVASAVRRGPL